MGLYKFSLDTNYFTLTFIKFIEFLFAPDTLCVNAILFHQLNNPISKNKLFPLWYVGFASFLISFQTGTFLTFL